MSEFQSRIVAQRRVLGVVNSHPRREELMGLSRKSIDRWVLVNQIAPDSTAATLLTAISAKLFFLSNKSQQQVTEEYRNLEVEVATMTEALRLHLNEVTSI